MKPNVSLSRPHAAEIVGDALLDRFEVAPLFSMSAGALAVSLHRGTFPVLPIRIGRRLRWRASDIRRFLNGEDVAK